MKKTQKTGHQSLAKLTYKTDYHQVFLNLTFAEYTQ